MKENLTKPEEAGRSALRLQELREKTMNLDEELIRIHTEIIRRNESLLRLVIVATITVTTTMLITIANLLVAIFR